MILDYELELDVPFADKDSAKAIGVKAKIENNKFKCWCVPIGKDVLLFEKWWPASFRNQIAPVNPDEIKSYSLTQVMNGVTKSIQQGLPNAIWIKAEITGVTGGAHKYYEVVDYEAVSNGAPVKGRAVIFGSQSELLRKFEEDTGMKLSSGMKIMFQAYVEFSGQYGLSLRIINLNSEFVLGQAELNLKAIRTQLEREGLISKNKSIPLPKEFTKIALIAPDGAAGLGDLMTQANVLMENNLCSFSHYPALFQGNNAVNSIIGAFTSIYNAIQNGEQYDAIVIIRGGGDKAGLYALNEYSIAKALCLMPVPVIVGIGHERDSTILDEVACIRLPTPSLVISYISGIIVSNMKEMISLTQELKSLSAQKCNMARQMVYNLESLIKDDAVKIIESAKREIDLASQSIKDASMNVILSAKREVTKAEDEMKSSSSLVLIKARQEVTLLTQEILYNDPKKIIDRGYTVVRKESGKVTGSGHEVSQPGTNISIQFRDTIIQATTK
jgi:exodeoxyribonuclease VII large subunit